MSRSAGLSIALGALITLSLPAEASAGWLRGGHVDSGSYSPLHYWTPRLYTYRAYHRPVNYIDVAEYDLGETDVIPGESRSMNNPEMSPPPKKEPAPAPPPKKEAGKN